MIELKGVGTVNKGAHLMLLSIFAEFRKRNFEDQFCIKPSTGMDFFSAAKNGIFLKADFKGKHLPWNRIISLLPGKTRKNYGLILDRELDVILDASGFAYGDFWGHRKIQRNLDNFLKKKTSANLILLPQAFGPFNKKKVRQVFEKVVDRAVLIFARDDVSYQHLVQTYGKRPNFRKAPDFTNLLSPGELRTYSEGTVCIIPNYKMMPSEEEKEKYFRFLSRSIEAVRKENRTPYFLIHEGVKDKQIAVEINEQLNHPLEIVHINDPLMIKNRIGSADLIIVSRFHGLVSALSQGTPAITTSWNHKYEELVKDYELGSCLINLDSYRQKDLENLIRTLILKEPEDHRSEQKEHIKREKERTKEMWNEVFKVISNPE